MTRWDALTTICSYLGAELLGSVRDAPQDISWELIVEIASFHRVAPALAACLKDDVNVPPDVRAYFDALAELNQKRNDLILDGIARVAKILNAIDIEPILLKGAALLVDRIYLDSSQRLLGDVDILIPANRSADANAAMMAAGFSTHPADVVPPPNHHHLPMLRDPETEMGVELHTDVISTSPDAVISTSWFIEQSRRVLFRNHRLRLPEPTRNAGHIIYHSEISHLMYSLDKIQLRHMLDLALIRARHEDDIDWSELDRRFSAGGHGEVLATYLNFAGALFGQSTPALSCAPREGAIEALRNTESQNSFVFQINFWKSVYGDMQTSLSRMIADFGSVTADRDRFKDELEPMIMDRDRFKEDRDRFKEDRDRFKADRDRFKEELERTAIDRDWFKDELERMIMDRDRFKEDRDRFREDRDRFKEDRDRFKEDRDRFREDRDWFKGEFERMAIDRDMDRDRFKEELERMTMDRDLFKAELARMTDSRDMLLAKIRRLTASRLWRWSAPLRNLISRD